MICLPDRDASSSCNGREMPPVKRLRSDVTLSRVDLLMTYQQMVADGYPLPYLRSGMSLVESIVCIVCCFEG